MNTENHDDFERQVDQPMALVTAIQKAEIDQQMTTARAFPRSIKRFSNAVLDMATLNATVAESCLYALPRAGKTIEGPSARFAEIVASAWGNSRSGARVVAEEGEFIVAQGIFHDLEANVMTTMEVKRRITDRDGKRFNADMIAVTGNAAASIAHRNAVLKGCPKVFWEHAYLAAKATATGDLKSLANTRADAFAWLQKHHVSEAMALACLGLEAIEDVGLDELATLKGAIAAVKSGEATIETAFAPKGTTPPKSKPKTDKPKGKDKPKKGADTPAKDTAPTTGTQPAATTVADPAAPAFIDKTQLDRLMDKINAEGIPENAVLAKFEIGALSELPASQMTRAIDWLDSLT